MQPASFYTSDSSNAVLLVLLTVNQVTEGLQGIHVDHGIYLRAQHFTGQWGEVVYIPSVKDEISTVYVGADLGQSDAKAIAHAVMRLPAGSYISSSALSEQALLMWSVAQYHFDRYKKKSPPLRVLCVQSVALSSVLAKSSAIFLARDLINTPTNDLGPQELGEVVETLAHRYDGNYYAWVGDDLLHENFPAIHAVGRAAQQAPRLLSLTWGKSEHPRVTLVGKGVCFDSGGLDIKPSSAMRLMKKDMGGAAIVLGLADWIMASKLPIYLQVLIPAVENSIASNAYRPGDVLTMRNGLRVEIDNTDAEGRLILADALSYACEQKPDLLIDFATLTGAARVAVGTEISAVFSADHTMAQSVIACGAAMGDAVWHMPLYAGYESMLSSSIADLMNSSPSPYAGAIIAALFLQRFIAPELSWLHFDIMAWNVSSKPGKPEGGEAMGLLAVAEYLRQRYT